MSDYLETTGATVQPAPKDHEKDVFVLVMSADEELRFALSEAQAHAMQDQLADATNSEVSP